jgi:hypothetical protein
MQSDILKKFALNSYFVSSRARRKQMLQTARQLTQATWEIIVLLMNASFISV